MGEGQLPTVKEHEIPQLLEAFNTLGEQYKYEFEDSLLNAVMNSHACHLSGFAEPVNPLKVFDVSRNIRMIIMLFLIFSPKVVVIVVTKKINTRFFAPSGGGLQNPPPGTVVDTEVTKPEW